MEITPACYAHLLSPLLALAEGRVAVILEGGYCLESLAEGAALTLKTLLGDPCPLLFEPLKEPCESIQETILNCIHSHRPYWKCLQTNRTYNLEELDNVTPNTELHKITQMFKGGEPLPERFQTKNFYAIQSDEEQKEIAVHLAKLKAATVLKVPAIRVGFVYDENQPETSEIEQKLREYRLVDRLERIPSRLATSDEICVVHTHQYVNRMREVAERSEMQAISEKCNSMCSNTLELAVGSVLQVVDAVLNETCRSGICVIRPFGHQVKFDKPGGSCAFKNVAIAAQHAINGFGLKRVLIVDWDVNNTQHIFESSPNVLYISLHSYDYGSFSLKNQDEYYTLIGSGCGEGFNVNIPWSKVGMDDMEYAMAFQRIIMPIAYEFSPELVLISAAFNAAIGEPLGGFKVTPEAYGYFTHWLSSLANGRVIICLEDNVNLISHAMGICAKALLGDPLPPLSLQTPCIINASCIETIQNVLDVQQKYWKSLRFNKKLPNYSD